MTHAFDGFSVGEVMIVGSFRVTPSEVMANRGARMLDARLEGVGHPRFGRDLLTSTPAEVPQAVLWRKAMAVLSNSPRLRGGTLRVHEMARPQRLSPVVVGEQISCIASVRFNSRGPEGTHTFVTLVVELRGSRGATLTRFEVGVELPLMPSTPDRGADRLQAA